MTAVTPAVVAREVASPPSAPLTGAPPTLPEGRPLSGVTIDDAMSGMYLVLSQLREGSLAVDKDRVAENDGQRDKAIHDQLAAIEEQERDQQDGGFWHDVENVVLTVAKVALAVGSVAATLASAGAASPLLVCSALALSAGGTVVAETKVFGSSSAAIGAGLEIAGGVLSLGVGIGTALSSASSATGAAGGTASAAESGGAGLLGTVSRTANYVGGGAQLVGGGAHVVATVYDANAQRHGADIDEAQHDVDRLNRTVKFVLQEAQATDKRFEHAEESLQGAIQTKADTAVTATSISYRG